MNLAIVIPAYNEEKNIGRVIAELPKKLVGVKNISVIVVDDGSTDKTYKIASQNADVVLRHRLNLGAGSATVTGLKYAKDFIKPDIVLTMDSDGQHSSADIPRLISPILSGKADVVIGSRLINTKGMPKVKIVTNKIANIITYLFSGIMVSDSQSGMRAYNARSLTNIDIKTTGYEYCTEVFSEIKRLDLKLTEIPIKVIYSDYSKRKGQPIANSANILVKLLVRSLTSRR